MLLARHHEVNVDGPLPGTSSAARWDRVHRDERVHPAAMGGRDEQVATVPGEMLPARGLDPQTARAEQHEAGDEPKATVRPNFGPAAEPVEPFLRAAARGRQRLWPEPGAWPLLGRCLAVASTACRSRPHGVELVEVVEVVLASGIARAADPAGGSALGHGSLLQGDVSALPGSGTSCARPGAAEPPGSTPISTNAAPKSWAVGMSPIRQLPIRRNSTRNRTRPIQMNMIPARSPIHSHGRGRLASQIKTSAPMSPLSDSYRKSGWKWVWSTGNVAHGYSAMRCSQSIATPHGRSSAGRTAPG